MGTNLERFCRYTNDNKMYCIVHLVWLSKIQKQKIQTIQRLVPQAADLAFGDEKQANTSRAYTGCIAFNGKCSICRPIQAVAYTCQNISLQKLTSYQNTSVQKLCAIVKQIFHSGQDKSAGVKQVSVPSFPCEWMTGCSTSLTSTNFKAPPACHLLDSVPALRPRSVNMSTRHSNKPAASKKCLT